MDVLNGLLTAAYLLSIVFLFLYGINCYIMIGLHKRFRGRGTEEQNGVEPSARLSSPQAWGAFPLPIVTIQLPLYNEKYVVRRLIQAVAALDYPKERLEVQVLDDSTDETVAIVEETVKKLKLEGLAISHIRREHRTGYKAGALEHGLRIAQGEFIAIFDADFVPPSDFLKRALPFFSDPAVAAVQARWGHLNDAYSPLTAAQALGIDGHFGVEQAARCWGGLFLNFNGTAGIWRKAAIQDAGGWGFDTLTEDLDLSYRAQLRGWKLLYLPDLVCPAELPVEIHAFKSQQHRWAKGSIQTALKLVPSLLRAPLPPLTKYQAVLHLTHYLVHPLMLTVALLSIPLLLLQRFFPSLGWLLAAAVLLSLATFGPSSLYFYSQRKLHPNEWPRRLRAMPFLMLFGTGIAVSNTKAVLEAVFGRRNEFIRTPKYGVEQIGGSAAIRGWWNRHRVAKGEGSAWKGKAYRFSSVHLGFLELFMAFYCGVAFFLFIHQARYLITPFLLIYTSGFLYVSFLTFAHALPAHKKEDRRFRRHPEIVKSLPGGKEVKVMKRERRRSGWPLHRAKATRWIWPLMLLGTILSLAPSQGLGLLADSPWPKYRRNLQHTGRALSQGPETNTLQWVFSTGRKEAEGGIETDPTLGPDGTVYIGANNGLFYALDGKTGEVRWAFPTLFDRFAIYSTAVVDKEGRVYVGAKDGYLYVLKAPKEGILGEVVWTFRIGSGVETSPAIAEDGTVYIGADDWKLHAIAPPRKGKEGRLLWSFQTKGTLISSPVIGPDRTLFEGSMDGNLYAFGPKSGAKASSGPSSGTWYGTYQDSRTKGRLTLVLRQAEDRVTGIWRLSSTGARGELTGELKGEEATFTLENMPGPCPGRFTGLAQLQGGKISGTYSGSDCKGKVSGGRFEVER